MKNNFTLILQTEKEAMAGCAFDALVFDLDDTIYPADSGIWKLIGDRIYDFMISHLPDVPREEIPVLRDRLLKQYGTTLRGLLHEYHISVEEYLDYVHDVDLHSVLAPDPSLEQALAAYQQPLYIFTNASTEHACNVLNVMEIRHLFKGITSVSDVLPYCKPDLEAYQIMLERFGLKDPHRVLFADDNPRNVAAARSFGMVPLLANRESADFISLKDIHKINMLIPPHPEQQKNNQ